MGYNFGLQFCPSLYPMPAENTGIFDEWNARGASGRAEGRGGVDGVRQRRRGRSRAPAAGQARRVGLRQRARGAGVRGLRPGHRTDAVVVGRFPARVDLLAADLGAVAASSWIARLGARKQLTKNKSHGVTPFLAQRYPFPGNSCFLAHGADCLPAQYDLYTCA